MKHVPAAVAAMTALALVSGCATPPLGPTVTVMPAPNKPFEVFQQDDAVCRQFAEQQTAGATEFANNAQLGSALLGTGLGAALGAAIGGGHGAAVGAGAGALGGTLVGTNGAERSTYSTQQRYNIAYSQCMYSHGNQVPGYVATRAPAYAAPAPPPPPMGAMPPPPPPPGMPPPPPPSL